MFRILIISAFFTILTLPTQALHIVGGSIYYEHLDSNMYKIRLEVLRDCAGGGSNFDDTIPLAVYDQNLILIQEYFIGFIGIVDVFSIQVPNSVCEVPPEVCISRTFYEIEIDLPPITGGYDLAFQRCCRSSLITNLDNAINKGMTFRTHINPIVPNNSPVFPSEYPFAAFFHTPFSFNGSGIDMDGDSLVYELTYSVNGGSNAFVLPSPPLPPPYDSIDFISPPYSIDNIIGGDFPLTLNPETGLFEVIPTTIGVFQISYLIKEYRNGQHIGTTFREFPFVVLTPIPNQFYNVKGNVLVNNSPVDSAKVQLIQRDIITDSLYVFEEQYINETQQYQFDNIPNGIFYVKAIVDSSSIYFDEYLPTYFDSAPFWYDAIPLNQCDTSQVSRNIQLIHVDSFTGIIILDGIVSNAGRSFDPASELSLLLGNENGELLQARSTNDQGYFKFENLTPGTYHLFADLINSSIDNTNPPMIELNENTAIQVYLYEDSLSLQLPPTSLQPNVSQNEYSINIYPNPSIDKIHLSIYSEESGIFSAKIFNICGQCVLTIFENKLLIEGTLSQEINLEDFSTGSYFVELNNNKSKKVEYFIKQ